MAQKPNKLAEILLDFSQLHADLHNNLKNTYFNSQSIISFPNNLPLMNISFDLIDILLIAAITKSNILLSGSSGSGKTYLAELVATSLFGKSGYTRKNITPDMNEQDFMDIDFGAIRDGKKLKDAMMADDLFNNPCIIIDEANRAPPIIQNRLMQILENNIDLKSKTIKAGKLLPNKDYYHWNILTLNYGDEYAGTSIVDRALKDRIVIDIPIDNFPPTIDDQIHMIRNSLKSQVSAINNASQTIYDIFSNLENIPLSIEAEALILYMSFMSNCVKSKNGSKYGINFSPQFCKENDCQYARNPPLNSICPYTFAPSNRILRNLVHTAKGFTLLKHAKIVDHILSTQGEENAMQYALKVSKMEVSKSDVIQIAPIILHSKISMNRDWILQKFNGSTFLACHEYIKVINGRLDYFIKNILRTTIKEKEGQSLSEKEQGILKKALREDFHFNGMIKYVKEYLS